VQRRRDRRRDARLRRLGWRVVRVPSDEAHTAPALVERSIRRA
jgi:very-short-patch-repair endonuclease